MCTSFYICTTHSLEVGWGSHNTCKEKQPVPGAQRRTITANTRARQLSATSTHDRPHAGTSVPLRGRGGSQEVLTDVPVGCHGGDGKLFVERANRWHHQVDRREKRLHTRTPGTALYLTADGGDQDGPEQRERRVRVRKEAGFAVMSTPPTQPPRAVPMFRSLSASVAASLACMPCSILNGSPLLRTRPCWPSGALHVGGGVCPGFH